MTRRAASWLLMALVVGVALVVGAGGDGGPPTDEERAARLATEIRCPTCRSQSAADSDAPAADFVREEIRRRVAEGQSDRQVRDYFTSRYGDDILLDPPRSGVATFVWALPVVGTAGAVTGLALAFRRWRPRRRPVTAADRAIVEEAMKE